MGADVLGFLPLALQPCTEAVLIVIVGYEVHTHNRTRPFLVEQARDGLQAFLIGSTITIRTISLKPFTLKLRAAYSATLMKNSSGSVIVPGYCM